MRISDQSCELCAVVVLSPPRLIVLWVMAVDHVPLFSGLIVSDIPSCSAYLPLYAIVLLLLCREYE